MKASPAGERGPRPGRPNILFILADQFRADCVGADGNSTILTPNLDRIACQGVRFEHAYSSTPTCTPARAAILTGLSPWRHGMLGFWQIAQRYPTEMPRALGDAGYYPFGIGWMHYHPPDNLHGFRGVLSDIETRDPAVQERCDYHRWVRRQAPGVDPEATGLDLNGYDARPYPFAEELHRTAWTGRMAADFIRQYRREEPFFLKVSFIRPHSPYDPPARLIEVYRDEDMPPPHVGDWAAGYAPFDIDPPPPDIWHGDLGLAQVRRSRRGYYGSVSFVDEQIGLILTALEERGILENTFILFTSDHGDMLGDHHLWRKAYAYEGAARIPMLVRWPTGMATDRPRGRTLPHPVELRDVLPTFLDVAGVSPHPQLDGVSLMGLIEGRPQVWREYIDLEHNICYDRRNHWNALTDGRWKYVFHAFDGSEQLFDLESDPGELRDLATLPSHASALACWRGRMVAHLAERGDAFCRDGRLQVRMQPMLLSPHYPDGAAPPVPPRPSRQPVG